MMSMTALFTNDLRAADKTPLIPRHMLFGNPDRAAVELSPDGTQISWLAAVDGVLNVWVAPVSDLPAARAVTHDEKRGIRRYFWSYTNNHILYMQDKGGDEDWHIYSVDLKSGKEIDLTPYKKVAAQVVEVSRYFPEEILVGINNRDPRHHDVHRVNIKTGKSSLVQQNDEGYVGYITDDDLKIQFPEDLAGHQHSSPLSIMFMGRRGAGKSLTMTAVAKFLNDAYLTRRSRMRVVANYHVSFAMRTSPILVDELNEFPEWGRELLVCLDEIAAYFPGRRSL
ncbi:MAG: hypothetical protein IIC51_09610, partial [Planctomycetes bacterium]|nr:hypothetical protein [Planctomycetota bacterium]